MPRYAFTLITILTLLPTLQASGSYARPQAKPQMVMAQETVSSRRSIEPQAVTVQKPVSARTTCSTIFERVTLDSLVLSAENGEFTFFVGASYSDLILKMPATRAQLEDLKEILVRGGSDRKTIETPLERAFAMQAKTISFKQVAPHFVRLMTGIRPVDPNGTRNCPPGNCWNATLNWFDPETGISIAKPEDMEQTLESDFRLLRPEEKPRYGDVMVIKSGSILLHTATYINDEFIWNKMAFYDDAAFEFRRTSDMMYSIERNFRDLRIHYVRKKNARSVDHAFHHPERRARPRHPTDSWS